LVQQDPKIRELISDLDSRAIGVTAQTRPGSEAR